jgi:serine/threonine-protein kinase
MAAAVRPFVAICGLAGNRRHFAAIWGIAAFRRFLRNKPRLGGPKRYYYKLAVDSVEAGRVIAGKFELVRRIGRGSMGEVWVAHHRTLGENLALKLLTTADDGEVEGNAAAAARFLFEAQIAARLSRKTRHIVRVSDHGEENGVAYLVMELLDGETLETALAKSTRLPPDVAADVVTQIARALTQAHTEGVFHRDLKPANVFLSTDEEGRRLVKVLDFGIARTIHAHRVRGRFATDKGIVFGTPAYMSPEQAVASSKLDHRCDLWALSVIAYEALTGALPAEGQDVDDVLRNVCAGRMVSVRERLPGNTAALSEFFDCAFAHPIDKRFQTATTLAECFAAACTELPCEVPGAAPRYSTTAETDPPPPDESEATTHVLVPPTDRKRPIPIVLATLPVALCAGALVVWLAWPSTNVRHVAERSPSLLGTAAAGPREPMPTLSPLDTQDSIADPPPMPVASSVPRGPAHKLSTARGQAVPATIPTVAPPSRSAAPVPASPPRPQPKPRETREQRDKSEVL